MSSAATVRLIRPIWAYNRIIVNQWRLYNMLLWQENCEIKHVDLIMGDSSGSPEFIRGEFYSKKSW
jgi:hypothetical protein